MTRPCGCRTPRPSLHFVGFRGDEYTRAVRAFGPPDMIHQGWDRRAFRDICFECDTIVFAKGDENQPLSRYNFDDE